MKRNILIVWSLLIGFSGSLRADEGMWIPLLIEKYNIKIMQEKGFKLSAEDIYSVNKACMKDAVLIFGGGCTGEIISGEGLVITNHHCGRGMIQRQSSLEHDYLSNGFWAMSRQEELPNPGLTVTILKRMEDVTGDILNGVTDNLSSDERARLIDRNIIMLVARSVEGTGYEGEVVPFFMGNQYFLFVNEVFRDIRIVGAPPATIGNFGSETDNWVWPRHTGDFALFRIYADKDNKPADYSPDNQPYQPGYFFPISLKGVREGDFTMVFGYPGSTYQYVPSYYVDMMKNYINPKLIDIRTAKIEIMEAAMKTDPLIRIQYFVKKSGIANAWKKWQGEILGLEKMNTIKKKQDYESRFTDWVNSDNTRKEKYGNILPSYKDLYTKLREYSLVNSYANEVFGGAEAFRSALSVRNLVELSEKDASEDEIQKTKERILAGSRSLFRDYNLETDKKLFVAVMTMYGENVDEKWLIPEFVRFRNGSKRDFSAAAEKLYDKSIFTDETKFVSFVEKFNKSSAKKAKKDIFYILGTGASDYIAEKVRSELVTINLEIQWLNKLYMTAQMEFDKGKVFYPDANFTLRITYGQVGGYKAKDAVYYTHYTTLKGIMEKDNPEIFDYDVPDKLRELYEKKDFGRYTQDGEVPVCFIANNHTTGGNSGSPVINADGHLIGINFDRAWEGVASDLAFNPDQSRNISLDIRYALFIIDKFAGAGYLLDEMRIIE